MPIAITSPDSDSEIFDISPPSAYIHMVDQKYPINRDSKADMAEVKPEVKSEKELQQRVDEAVQRVREQSDRLQAVALPYAQKIRDFADRRPVFFTYLAIFAALSAVPVFCFVTFLLTSTMFILGVAAIGICLTILGTILFATSILLPVLLFTLITSTCILSFLLFLFLAHRLYLHITASSGDADEHLIQGVRNWVDETKERVDTSLGLKGRVRWADLGGATGKWTEDVVKKENGNMTLTSDAPKERDQ